MFRRCLHGIFPNSTVCRATCVLFLKATVRFFSFFIIDGVKKISDSRSELLSSSAVEQVTVNHLVAGSIPA